MKIKNTNYLNIEGWMRTELDLRGNELIIYAAIFGFSQDGSWSSASAQYLADWCGISKRATLDILKKLVEKELLEKKEIEENGVKFCHYRGRNFTTPVKKLHHPGEETSPPRRRNFTTPGEETSPNIKVTTTTSTATPTTTTSTKSVSEERPKKSEKKFVKPTIEEVSDYIQEKQLNVNPDQFFNYYESNGWMVGRNPMKNWKAALQTWHAKSKTSQQPTQTRAMAQLNANDQPYEPEPTEDIRPWREFFDEWQEILGMRPAQTVGNVRAAKQLKAENDDEMLTALMVALAMRSQTRYLTREIKNITTPLDLLNNRERVWSFYQEHRETWKWQQSMRRGAGLIN